MPTFSARIFGEDLALILDALYAVQQNESADFADSPTPLLGLFTAPTGVSWYEADTLTRHFLACDISLRVAMQKDAALNALFAGFAQDGRLTPLAVRQMLYERWLAQPH